MNQNEKIILIYTHQTPNTCLSSSSLVDTTWFFFSYSSWSVGWLLLLLCKHLIINEDFSQNSESMMMMMMMKTKQTMLFFFFEWIMIQMKKKNQWFEVMLLLIWFDEDDIGWILVVVVVIIEEIENKDGYVNCYSNGHHYDKHSGRKTKHIFNEMKEKNSKKMMMMTIMNIKQTIWLVEYKHPIIKEKKKFIQESLSLINSTFNIQFKNWHGLVITNKQKKRMLMMMMMRKRQQQEFCWKKSHWINESEIVLNKFFSCCFSLTTTTTRKKIYPVSLFDFWSFFSLFCNKKQNDKRIVKWNEKHKRQQNLTDETKKLS